MTKKQKTLNQVIKEEIRKLKGNQAGNWWLVEKDKLRQSLIKVAREMAMTGDIKKFLGKYYDQR